MKSHLYLFVSHLLVIVFGIQSGTTPESDLTPGPAKGTPTAVGKAKGAPTSKLIGAAGGSIVTPDGKLTLTFPSGALEKETSITIQPVENKAINGVRLGYEFLPDGSKFNKPVTWVACYQSRRSPAKDRSDLIRKKPISQQG